MRSLLGCLALALPLAATVAAQPRPNVVFLIADDLTAEALRCYGNAQCSTPAIDALAARGARFTRAYCQFPVCGPSRAALMAGMYPQALGVTGNGGAGNIDALLRDRPSLAQWFLQHGYHTARVSKIFHMRVPGDITAGVHGPDHAASWSERYSVRAPEWQTEGEPAHLSNERLKHEPDRHYNLGFGTAFYVVRGASDGAEQADVLAADRAVELLRAARLRDAPFFLAVGFVRPHVPLVAPARFHDAHPAAEMRLAVAVEGDVEDIPAAGRSRVSASFGIEAESKQRAVLSAYYAAVAFMDAQVGRVLAALDELGLADDTIVVFTSDHGYHLGEHGFWQKLSLHEESARIPLLVAGPGIAAGVRQGLAQQIDLYPTLAELAGLAVPEHLQGRSLVPLLRDPLAAVHDEVLSVTRRGALLRTRDWAYLAWRDGSEELYDMVADPRQFTNLAGAAGYAAVHGLLRERLGALQARVTAEPAPPRRAHR